MSSEQQGPNKRLILVRETVKELQIRSGLRTGEGSKNNASSGKSGGPVNSSTPTVTQ